MGMNLVASSLLAILLGVSQILCACPADWSAAATAGPVVSVHSHQSHGPHKTPPCDSDDGQCDMQSVAIAKNDAASKVVSPLDTTAKTPVVLPGPISRIIQVRAPPPSNNSIRRRYPPLLTPLLLKVRLLN